MSPTHLAQSFDDLALEDASIEIEGDAYRHLFRSRRLAVGDALRVVDGRGRARRGTVAEVDRKRAVVTLGEALDSREPTRRVRLVVGAPRPERAAWLVEKATELGVDRIAFVATERTPRDYGDGRLDRLRRMAASAVEQCRRSWCPPVEGVLPWGEAVERFAPGAVLVPGAKPLDASSFAGESTNVWIGPEGGFSEDELAELVERDVVPAGLGIGVLRVETAAVAAAALLLCSEEAASETDLREDGDKEKR